jgi:hypothetical protein
MTDPYTGDLARIDDRMVPVIARVWDEGIRTWYCCEGLRELADLWVFGPDSCPDYRVCRAAEVEHGLRS